MRVDRRVLFSPFAIAVALLLIGLAAAFWFRGDGGRREVPINSVTVSSDGKELTVRYPAGDPDCASPAGIQVDGDDREIRLAAAISADDECGLGTTEAEQTITLRDPLGDRAVIDVTVEDRPVPVETLA